MTLESDDCRAKGSKVLPEAAATVDRLAVLAGEISGDIKDLVDGIESEAWLTPFQSASWLDAWRRSFGAGSAEPVTAIAFNAGQPILVLPLCRQRHFGATYLTWQAHEQSDYCAPIVHRGFLERLAELDGAGLLRGIAGQLGGVDLIHLSKQPARIGATANPFISAQSLAHHARAHAITFAKGETWEDYYKRRRSAKTRRRLKAKRNALNKLGEVVFRLAETPAQAKAMAAACIGMKSQQLREAGHWDTFSQPGVTEFLVDYFSAKIGQESWAASLDLNGEIIAATIGFRGPAEWLLYQMSMKSRGLAAHSPGTHLLMHLMQHCIARGASKLDLSLGDETYKLDWCDETIALATTLMPLTLKGSALCQVIGQKARLQTRLASNPRLYEASKHLRGLIRKAGIRL